MTGKFKILMRYCENYLSFSYYLLFTHRCRAKTFKFRGKAYEYLNRVYNTTWRNERTVEVPIAWLEVRKEQGEILEVGNVLSHYYPTTHDVVDLFERAARVINENICTYNTEKRYDLIVCISTLEHVGGEKKILKAFNNLRRLLKPKGRVLITVPMGLNQELDEMLRSRKLPFTRTVTMVRYSDQNLWKESDKQESLSAKFDFRIPRANAIIIGEFTE